MQEHRSSLADVPVQTVSVAVHKRYQLESFFKYMQMCIMLGQTPRSLKGEAQWSFLPGIHKGLASMQRHLAIKE